MICKIVSFVVPIGPPYYANGGARAVSRCETHNMQMPDMTTTAEALCPIGKIEDATTKALAAINAATDDAIASILEPR